MSYRKKHSPSKPEKQQESRETLAEMNPSYRNPGDDRSIYTGRLTSGLPYQRTVNPKEVDRLVREWDERLLEPIIVSFRDGKFNVVDGQHRIAAIRKMNGGNGVMVNCKVYSGLTYEQEADLCYKLDKAKKRNTWQGNIRSLSAAVISGMALFVKTYDTELDDRTFVKRLSGTDPYEIVRRGKADFSTSKAALRYARIILEKYNAPRGGKKLPYRLH